MSAHARLCLAWRAVGLVALVSLAACSSMPTRVGSESAARTEREPARGVEPAEQSATPREADSAAGEAAAAVLERRRRDYPAIEADATGFTITEQIRISGDVRADYDRALELLAQNRDAEGIALLVGVTERAPDVTAPFIDLGIAYGRTDELDKAEAALTTAVLLSPEHPIAHNELGILYRKTGRFIEARAAYEQALAVYSDFHFARRNLAVLCDLYLRDLGCALENYTAYLSSVSDDREVEIWAADIRNRLGQQESPQ